MKVNSVSPFIFLAIYITFIIFFKIKFPDPQSFIEIIKNLYSTHGYVLIFLGAFLEGLFPVGFYFPGSAIVILGAAFSRTGIVAYPLVLLIGTSGLVLGYICNYILGRYGLYKVLSGMGFKEGIESAKHKLVQHQTKTIILGYFIPSSASFLSLASGVLHVPFRKFLLLSIFAQSMWGFIWGTIAYWFGIPFVEFVLKYFFIIIFVVLGIWIVRKLLKGKINP